MKRAKVPIYRVRQYSDSFLEYKVEAASREEAKELFEKGKGQQIFKKPVILNTQPIQIDDIEEIKS